MKKLDLEQRISELERQAYVLCELLEGVERGYFTCTLDGLIERKIAGSNLAGDFWWMHDNYGTVSALVRAAVLIAGGVTKYTSQLHDDVFRAEEEGVQNEEC